MEIKNKSREYLLALSLDDRKALADSLSVRQEYLYQIGKNLRNPSREFAVMLEIKTGGKVKERDFVVEIKSKINSEVVA